MRITYLADAEHKPAYYRYPILGFLRFSEHFEAVESTLPQLKKQRGVFLATANKCVKAENGQTEKRSTLHAYGTVLRASLDRKLAHFTDIDSDNTLHTYVAMERKGKGVKEMMVFDCPDLGGIRPLGTPSVLT